MPALLFVLLFARCNGDKKPDAAQAQVPPSFMNDTSLPNCFAEPGDFTFEVFSAESPHKINLLVAAYFPNHKMHILPPASAITKSGHEYTIELPVETLKTEAWETDLVLQNIEVVLPFPFEEGDEFLVKVDQKYADIQLRNRIH